MRKASYCFAECVNGQSSFFKTLFFKVSFFSLNNLIMFYELITVQHYSTSSSSNFILRALLLLSLQARFCELYQYTFFIYVY